MSIYLHQIASDLVLRWMKPSNIHCFCKSLEMYNNGKVRQENKNEDHKYMAFICSF